MFLIGPSNPAMLNVKPFISTMRWSRCASNALRVSSESSLIAFWASSVMTTNTMMMLTPSPNNSCVMTEEKFFSMKMYGYIKEEMDEKDDGLPEGR